MGEYYLRPKNWSFEQKIPEQFRNLSVPYLFFKSLSRLFTHAEQIELVSNPCSGQEDRNFDKVRAPT